MYGWNIEKLADVQEGINLENSVIGLPVPKIRFKNAYE